MEKWRLNKGNDLSVDYFKSILDCFNLISSSLSESDNSNKKIKISRIKDELKIDLNLSLSLIENNGFKSFVLNLAKFSL